MNILILTTGESFVKSIEKGIQQGKTLINYWTNGVLPQGDFERIDIFNGDKLVVSGILKSMDIDTIQNSYQRYSSTCAGMMSSQNELIELLAMVFGNTPDPIGNVIIQDYKFNPTGLLCDYSQRSKEKFTYANIPNGVNL